MNGLVWGYAKPDNVIVGSSGDAIVIDFGGGFCRDYIKPELMNTKDDDFTGLEEGKRGAIGGGRWAVAILLQKTIPRISFSITTSPHREVPSPRLSRLTIRG